MTHQGHNRLIHAIVGNTSTGGKAEPVPSVLNEKGNLVKLPLNEDGNPYHPGSEIAMKQWAAYKVTWAEWWTGARVLDGDLANPYQVFPISFTFARRVVDPGYSNSIWRNFLPIMCVAQDGVPVPYYGQSGVDLTTNGLTWVWPQAIVMVAALFSAMNKSKKTYSADDVIKIASQTPDLVREAKNTISQIKEHLNKILNLKTAKRKAGYAEVVREFKERILEVQARANRARAAYQIVQKEFADLLVERDEMLARYDDNYERKKIGLEDQLEIFGLNDLPLVASAAQKRAPTLAPRPVLEADGVDPSIMDFLEGK
jgi:gas vesicle protein